MLLTLNDAAFFGRKPNWIMSSTTRCSRTGSIAVGKFGREMTAAMFGVTLSGGCSY